MVTLNPPEPPSAADTLAVINYAHPLLDGAAYLAQQALPSVQGLDRVYFAGAWASYGFHEDGLKSGLTVANLLGVYAPWQTASAVNLEQAA
jgi:predicted NAD/FAD-binding protein